MEHCRCAWLCIIAKAVAKQSVHVYVRQRHPECGMCLFVHLMQVAQLN